MVNRLMLGSGIFKREGWKTLDCKPGHDFVARIPPLPEQVKAIDWGEIEWIHGITSFHPWEADELLPQLYDAIILGGKLVLELPDATKCYEAGIPEWLFGDPRPEDSDHMNKWAYRPEDLTEMLAEVGFRRIEVLPAQHHVPERDFRVEAWR